MGKHKYAETYVRLSLYPMHTCITDTSAPSITKAIQILPIGTTFHLLLRVGKEMPATARIEAYLVRMLIRDFDELLIKGWQGIATVGLGRIVRCLGTGIGPSHDLGP